MCGMGIDHHTPYSPITWSGRRGPRGKGWRGIQHQERSDEVFRRAEGCESDCQSSHLERQPGLSDIGLSVRDGVHS